MAREDGYIGHVFVCARGRVLIHMMYVVYSGDQSDPLLQEVRIVEAESNEHAMSMVTGAFTSQLYEEPVRQEPPDQRIFSRAVSLWSLFGGR